MTAESSGSGSTLDSIFGLARDYIRTRYSRVPESQDPRQQAVPIPAATQVPSSPRASPRALSYLPVALAALVGALLLGLLLKKAG